MKAMRHRELNGVQADYKRHRCYDDAGMPQGAITRPADDARGRLAEIMAAPIILAYRRQRPRSEFHRISIIIDSLPELISEG